MTYPNDNGRPVPPQAPHYPQPPMQYAPPPVFVPPRQVPHAMHAIVSVMTCGLWIPVWIFDSLRK